jgi:large subunit ribosomal protein L28
MARKFNHKTRKLLAPKTRFGHNVSFSQRHTSRVFKPNLQWVTIIVEGKPVRLLLSARQIRTLAKVDPAKDLQMKLRKVASK